MVVSLGLGTAQFGCDYGISNARGRVPEDQVRQILALAAQAHITTLDIAPYGGDIERIVGRSSPFPSPFKPQIRTLSLKDRGLDWVETRLKRSIDHLGLARAHTALVDQAADLTSREGDALWSRLLRMKDEGLISEVGISALPEDRPLLLAQRFKPDMMQLPTSLFDQRSVKNGDIEALATLGVKVQLRSIFLQGLLFMPTDALPHNLQSASAHFSRAKRHLFEAGADPLQAALAFARQVKGADSLIIGVTSAAELRAILAAIDRPVPPLDYASLAIDDLTTLDPRRWFGQALGFGQETVKALARSA
jgi:D-threo-aldose 1-dehydrogenase